VSTLKVVGDTFILGWDLGLGRHVLREPGASARGAKPDRSSSGLGMNPIGATENAVRSAKLSNNVTCLVPRELPLVNVDMDIADSKSSGVR